MNAEKRSGPTGRRPTESPKMLKMKAKPQPPVRRLTGAVQTRQH